MFNFNTKGHQYVKDECWENTSLSSSQTGGKALSFTIKYNVECKNFLLVPFMSLRKFLLITCCWMIFVHLIWTNSYWMLLNASVLIEKTFFSFVFIWWIALIDFWIFCCCCLVIKLCLTLCNPINCSHPLSMGFPRQEYWSALPFPSSGDLPDTGIEPWSPALQADSV